MTFYAIAQILLAYNSIPPTSMKTILRNTFGINIRRVNFSIFGIVAFALASSSTIAQQIYSTNCIQRGGSSLCEQNFSKIEPFYWRDFEPRLPSSSLKGTYEQAIAEANERAKMNYLKNPNDGLYQHWAIPGICEKTIVKSLNIGGEVIGFRGTENGCPYKITHNGNTYIESIGNPARPSQRIFCPSGWAHSASPTENGEPGYCILSNYKTPPKKCGIPEICGGTNPIDIGTGNKFQAEIDVASGKPGAIPIGRNFNSVGNFPSANVGNGWRLSFDKAFYIDEPAYISVTRGDGKIFSFKKAVSGYVTDADIDDRLYALSDVGGNATGWLYVSADGGHEIYSASGKILREHGTSGHFISYEYEGNPEPTGKLKRILSSNGDVVALTYDENDRVIKIAIGSMLEIRYDYSSNGNLVAANYPDGAKRVYHYEDTAFPTLLTGITDENGVRYASWAYDSKNSATLREAVSSEHAGGVSRYSISSENKGNGVFTAKITDPLGTVRVYKFGTYVNAKRLIELSQPLANGGISQLLLTYDGNGNIASRTDYNGTKFTYEYDLSRNLETKRVEAAGKPEVRTVSTQWHSYWRQPVTQAEPLKRTTWIYNGDGGTYCAPQSATIPSLGGGTRPIGVVCQKREEATTDTNGSQGFAATVSGTARVWSWTYNQYGQVLTADGPRADVNDVTTYTYYDTSEAEAGKRGNIATITNALGHVTRISAYDPHGNPQTLIDPNGLTTYLTYDLRQRLTSKQVGEETTTYQYDKVGQLTKITLPDGHSLSYTYDGAHRLTAIADGLGNQIRYTLDAMGNRTKEELFDPNGQLSQTRSRAYDALNRLSKDMGANGQTTQYAYDANGNLTSITDPLNHTTTRGFDPLNRLIRITDPGSAQTRMTYDGQDRLTQVTDPRNLSTTYTLDGLGNLTRQTSPDTGVTESTHDAAGNRLTAKDAKGRLTTTQYDALNRPVQVTYGDGKQVRYTWDMGGNGIGRLGRVEEVTAGVIDAVTEYTYTPQGRLAVATTQLAGQSYATAYTYQGGELASLTYPSGKRLAYTRNAAGQITQIQMSDQGKLKLLASDIRYRPFGGVQSFTNGAGRIVTRTYDTDGRITSYSLAGQTWQLGYDLAGRIAYQTDTGNAANTSSYSYDSLDRLTGVLLPNTNLGYGYDATGNRTSQTVGGITYTAQIDPGSNRLQSINTAPPKSYGYDAAGSRTSDNSASYDYDARGRLTQTTSAVGTTQYRINALGQRVRKTGNNEDTLYHYDSEGHLIAESTPAGKVTLEYIWLGDTPIAVIQ